jgi:predicted glutamine amidotransferase
LSEVIDLCGLVGIAGEVGTKGLKAFERMLELDTYRGPHSTGVMVVKAGGTPSVAKQLGTPWDLYDHKSYKDAVWGTNIRVLLGHNRWATKGKINKLNAHPFEFSRVVGAHNGTLTNFSNLEDHNKFEVDSEALYNHLNTHGVDDLALKLKGAFALTWYNKEEETINLLRNKERPLFYALTKDRHTLLWASEDWMIMLAARQASLDLDSHSVKELPVGVLMSFPVNMDAANKPFSDVRVRRLELYEPPVYNYTKLPTTSTASTVGKSLVPFSTYQQYVGKSVLFSVVGAGKTISQQHYIEGCLVENDTVCVRVFPPHEDELWDKMLESVNYFQGTAKAYSSLDSGYLTIDLRTVVEVEVSASDEAEDTFLVFEKEEVTSDEFYERTKRGCGWCSNPVSLAESHELHWLSKYSFICGSCAEQEEVKTYLIK